MCIFAMKNNVCIESVSELFKIFLADTLVTDLAYLSVLVLGKETYIKYISSIHLCHVLLIM